MVWFAQSIGTISVLIMVTWLIKKEWISIKTSIMLHQLGFKFNMVNFSRIMCKTDFETVKMEIDFDSQGQKLIWANIQVSGNGNNSGFTLPAWKFVNLSVEELKKEIIDLEKSLEGMIGISLLERLPYMNAALRDSVLL